MALNHQQSLFLQAYLKEPNAKQAAIAAGYSPKTAAAAASRLLRHREIARLLVRGFKSAPTVAAVNAVDRWTSEMNRLAFDELPTDEFKYDHKLRAADLLAKAEGRYQDSVNVNSGLQININLGVFNKVESDD